VIDIIIIIKLVVVISLIQVQFIWVNIELVDVLSSCVVLSNLGLRRRRLLCTWIWLLWCMWRMLVGGCGVGLAGRGSLGAAGAFAVVKRIALLH